MRILSRAIFREVATSACLGTMLFVFVLFLRTIERLSALLLKTSAPPAVIAKLLVYALPATIPFALPLGVLVGILIGLSRMSADNEITAMRSAGVSSITVARPVLMFATLALIITATASLWLTPLSLHLETMIARGFAAAQLTGNIEARIFDEQFPDTVLYVNDVTRTAGQIVWHQLFMADVTSPEKLKQSGKDRGDGPRIIIAEEAIPHPDSANNRIILQMRNVRTSERDRDGRVVTTAAPLQIQVLQAQKEEDLQVNKTVQEMDVGPLYRRVYGAGRKGLSREDYTDAAIELHQRFALPLACVLLALVGIPLGISSRKGGKSAAFVLTVLVAFLYYLAFITLLGLAKKGSLPVPVAVWMPDAVFSVIGLSLLLQLERPGDRDITAWLQIGFTRLLGLFRRLSPGQRAQTNQKRIIPAFLLRPMLIDGYILNGFFFYFGLLVTSLVVLVEVFTFFELLGDMIKNNISMTTMLDYLWHLAPKLIYDVTPIGIMVASLICFGILTKHNEVTAFKAGGVSVHRLAAPVLVTSFAISVSLFAFDHYYIPEANRRQEMLRAEIKKKPVQTYLDPNRSWIYGEGSRIYNYQFLDPRQAVMSRVNVYELDPRTFRVVHQISAERARWEPALKTWVFQNGMSQEFHNGTPVPDFKEFYGASATFAELGETPSWFVKEEKEYKEMNSEELAQYIRELKGAGMETIPLQVQYYKKFSVPLFALIMALLSVPFAFVAGNRGAMTGVGISFGIAIAYWTLNSAFEQIGDLNQLPPAMAAWSPDVIFSLWGLYLLARMRT